MQKGVIPTCSSNVDFNFSMLAVVAFLALALGASIPKHMGQGPGAQTGQLLAPTTTTGAIPLDLPNLDGCHMHQRHDEGWFHSFGCFWFDEMVHNNPPQCWLEFGVRKQAFGWIIVDEKFLDVFDREGISKTVVEEEVALPSMLYKDELDGLQLGEVVVAGYPRHLGKL